MPFSVSALTPVTSTSTSISWPGGMQAGDVALLINYAKRSGSAPPYVTPSGFTLVGQSQEEGFADASGQIHRRICDGSESGAISPVMDGSSTSALTLLIFRPSAAANVTFVNTGSEVNQGDPSGQTITLGGQSPPAVAIGVAAYRDSFAAFSTESPAFENSTGTTSCLVGYTIYDEGDTPVNHSIDKNDQGVANWLASCYILFEQAIVELAADELTAAAALLDEPTLGQVHHLSAGAGITAAAPVLDAPALFQDHELVAVAIDAPAALLDTPDGDVIHPVVADPITMPSAILDTPVVIEAYALVADAVLAAEAIVGRYRSNYLIYSEELDHDWSHAFVTVTADAAVAPDGTMTAEYVQETADTAEHFFEQNIAGELHGGVGTASIFAKAGEIDRLVINSYQTSADTAGDRVLFDLTAETVSRTGGIDAGMVPYSDGWWRLWFTYNLAEISVNKRLRYKLFQHGSYAGDGSSGIFLWGAMLNAGELAPYVKTLGAQSFVGPVLSQVHALLPGGLGAPIEIVLTGSAGIVPTDNGDGTYTIDGTSGAGASRFYYDLADLEDGAEYLVEFIINSFSAPSAGNWDFADTTPYNSNYNSPPAGFTGRIFGYGRRADYTSIYRFVDIFVPAGGVMRVYPPTLRKVVNEALSLAPGVLDSPALSQVHALHAYPLGSEEVANGGPGFTDLTDWTVNPRGHAEILDGAIEFEVDSYGTGNGFTNIWLNVYGLTPGQQYLVEARYELVAKPSLSNANVGLYDNTGGSNPFGLVQGPVSGGSISVEGQAKTYSRWIQCPADGDFSISFFFIGEGEEYIVGNRLRIHWVSVREYNPGFTIPAGILGQPDITEIYAFVADPIDAPAALLDEPVMTQVHVTGAPDFFLDPIVLDEPALTQAHHLIPDPLNAAAPVVDSPLMPKWHVKNSGIIQMPIVHFKHEGTWKAALGVWRRVGGTWIKIYEDLT